MRLSSDYRLEPVNEWGPGGWQTCTKYMKETPGNWDENNINAILDMAESCVKNAIDELKIRGSVIRKKRSVGMIAKDGQVIPREALDETVLRVQMQLQSHPTVTLPFCAFNGGRDVWIDIGNKRVGVSILASYLGIAHKETIHIGDQFLNTGNDFAARDICPCIWIINPEETTYLLKTTLRLAGVPIDHHPADNVVQYGNGSGNHDDDLSSEEPSGGADEKSSDLNKSQMNTASFLSCAQRHSRLEKS